MLAWMRTGIALMGFGFVVARFGLFLREIATMRVKESEQGQPRLSLWVGTSLVLIGVAVILASAINHFRFRSKFVRGEPFITPKGLLALSVAILLAIVGIAMTLYLVMIGAPKG